jgi:predicted transcriptional regulator
MKTAISIPDEVFAEAEALARQLNRSRSYVYSHAVAEYVARHAPDRVTEAMNEALAEIEPGDDAFVRVAAQRTLERVEW